MSDWTKTAQVLPLVYEPIADKQPFGYAIGFAWPLIEDELHDDERPLSGRIRSVDERGMALAYVEGICFIELPTFSTPEIGHYAATRRLVASWNACRALPIEALELGSVVTLINAAQAFSDQIAAEGELGLDHEEEADQPALAKLDQLRDALHALKPKTPAPREDLEATQAKEEADAND